MQQYLHTNKLSISVTNFYIDFNSIVYRAYSNISKNIINKYNKDILIIRETIKIDYLSQIEHPSNLIVGQKVSRIGNSSIDIQSAIFLHNDPKPAANSVVSCVCFDYEQSKSVPVYDEIKSDFQLDK